MKDPDEEVQEVLDDLYADMRGVRKTKPQIRRKKKLNRKTDGVSPIQKFVKSLGDYYMVKEVAEELDRSEAWVRRWSRNTHVPSYKAPFGQKEIKLFTKEDIEFLRTKRDDEIKEQ